MTSRFDGHFNADIVWAIDPGDVHTGWAAFARSNDWLGFVELGHGTWWRAEAEEVLLSWAESWPGWAWLVVEDYRLYPDKATAQGYSDFPTSRQIGWIELVAAIGGVELTKTNASNKRSAYGLCNQLGIGPGDQGCDEDGRPLIHARDARAHGVYHIRKRIEKLGSW